MITEKQSYNIENGTKIVCIYCGRTTSGTVVDSRCKYGVRKQYTVELAEPLTFDWSGSDKQVGDRILIENTDVVKIIDPT